jgi:hypothetical protein
LIAHLHGDVGVDVLKTALAAGGFETVYFSTPRSNVSPSSSKLKLSELRKS